MAPLRAILQAALTGLGILVAVAGATLAASIEVPPGGGDIPTGFALLFSWGLTGVGIAVFAFGLVLLDDSGLGTFFTHSQRRVIRIGAGFILLAALLPFIGLFLLPVFYGVLGPTPPGQTDTLLSNILMVWLGIATLGGLGVVGGVIWRIGEAFLTWAHERQTA